MALNLEEARKSIENYITLERTPDVKNIDIINILTDLKAMEMTKGILTKSKIGISINKLRKIEDEEVSNFATEILLKWKEVMIPAKRKFESESDEVILTTSEKNENAINEESCSKEEIVETNPTGSPLKAKVEVSLDLKNYFIGNSVRDKCLEMLVTSLMVDQNEDQSPDELIINTAQSIERILFTEFKGTTPAYKSKFRSKYLNLKDKNNPTLRSGLISGIITPDRFISMTSAEMASDERRRVNSMIAEQNLLNSQLAKDNAAETDQFKCGRCNQRKCKYYQMQTRSADEPMTTFVTCVNCGNRWRVRREILIQMFNFNLFLFQCFSSVKILTHKLVFYLNLKNK